MEIGISNVVHPGWSISYELLQKGTAIARSGGIYQGIIGKDITLREDLPHLGLHYFIFWQEAFNPIKPKQKASQISVLSRLICDEDFKPRYYQVDAEGIHVSIEFHDHEFLAKLPNGEPFKGTWEGSDFLLEGNMVAQLALKVRLLSTVDKQSYTNGFFSPGNFQVIPYQIEFRELSYITTNFEEKLVLDQEGWIEKIHLKDEEYLVHRITKTIPKWVTTDTQAPRKRHIKTYNPPINTLLQLEEIKIEVGDIHLDATIALPSKETKKIAFALFIGGSGMHDRHGFGNGIDLGYHELLDQLASKGIVNLRFDKRGVNVSHLGAEMLNPSYNRVIDDARHVLHFACSQVFSKQLPFFLIGHSQGGLVALELAAHTPNLNGVILLSTAARNLEEVFADQLIEWSKEVDIPREAIRERINEMHVFFDLVRNYSDWTPENVPATVYALRNMRPWYAELLARDPTVMIQGLASPILIVQCDEDVQVFLRDAELLYEAARTHNPNVEMIVLRGCDHLFKRATARSGLKSYFDYRRRVSKKLINAVATWIANQSYES